MNRIFRRSFCTAKSQLARHGYISFHRNAVLMGIALGGAAGGGLAATVFIQSSELDCLDVQLRETKGELKASQEAFEKLTRQSQREKDALEATVAEKESIISDKESALDDAKSTIDSKVQALNAQDFILSQTKNKLNETSKQHSKLQRRHKDLKSVKTKLTGDLTNCVKTRETTVQRLKRERKELEASYEVLNNRANNLESIIGDLRTELRAKRS